ncbi:MAG: hypothetical protein K6B72_02110 [Lachnospiraceae bacterium]|nr:hypothetical protein [Lachnospiraceae bacterium]
MKDLYNDLHGACEAMSRELGEMVDKIEQNGWKMSGSDLEMMDKLTHGIKSVKTTMAMMDAEGGSFDDGSYARGRRSYARGRDSMGRYTSRRAYDDGMRDDYRA